MGGHIERDFEVFGQYDGFIFHEVKMVEFETDQKKYLSIAEAHADFANRINEKLKRVNPEASIFVCPLQYHGRGHEPYISLLGNSLDSDIDLMWTGRQICSEYLEVQDAIVFQESTSKSALYWDNYPVNDVAMVHQLHIGPIQKRDKELGNHSIGLVANPMDRFESSLLPLATVADYLWDSESYEAQNSWDRVLKDLIVNEDDRNALRHLFRNCFESCLAVDAAPDFGAVLSQATFGWRTGQANFAAELLVRYATEALRNFEIISSKEFSWPEIQPEILNKKGCLFLTRPSVFPHNATHALLQENAKAVFDAITKGYVKVQIGAKFPLEQAAEAHRAAEGRKGHHAGSGRGAGGRGPGEQGLCPQQARLYHRGGDGKL